MTKKTIISLCCLLGSAIFYAQPERTYTSLEKAFEAPEQVYILRLERQKIERLPDSISEFKNLKELKLEGNFLESLPESIGELSQLEKLSLRSNRLEVLPESIGNLANLTELLLWNNRLETLPESIGQLTNLTKFDFFRVSGQSF